MLIDPVMVSVAEPASDLSIRTVLLLNVLKRLLQATLTFPPQHADAGESSSGSADRHKALLIGRNSDQDQRIDYIYLTGVFSQHKSQQAPCLHAPALRLAPDMFHKAPPGSPCTLTRSLIVLPSSGAPLP